MKEKQIIVPLMKKKLQCTDSHYNNFCSNIIQDLFAKKIVYQL